MNLKKAIDNVKGDKNIFNINLDNIISRNLEIDATDLDGEKVMMNLDKGQYFMMNEVGSRVWELIEKPKSVKEIIALLLEEYEVEENECEEQVKSFLAILSKDDLIEMK